MDLVYKEFDEAHDKVSHSYPGITRRTAWGLTPYITAKVQKSPFHRRGMRFEDLRGDCIGMYKIMRGIDRMNAHRPLPRVRV